MPGLILKDKSLGQVCMKGRLFPHAKVILHGSDVIAPGPYPGVQNYVGGTGYLGKGQCYDNLPAEHPPWAGFPGIKARELWQ